MIKKLPTTISNKIAAGEVIERPAAVVKELVENAIDAEATAITIEIKEAGKTLISVVDNGSGISETDLNLLFERHATSKIETLDDIYKIDTLGFRGEALASIASVSRITLKTKTKTMQSGLQVTVNGGQLSKPETVAAIDGTNFRVTDLFYNTPVRYKFLKSDQAEQAAIIDTVNKMVLSHPQIMFSFIVDGKDVYHTDGRGELDHVLLNIYGRELVKNIFPVNDMQNDYGVKGYISNTTYTRGNKRYQNVFINGRYVISRQIQDAVNEAYKMRITIGRFPAFVLLLTMPCDTLDVNIHPTKTQVKFDDENRIKNFIKNAVNKTLESHSLVPEMALTQDAREARINREKEEQKIVNYFANFKCDKTNKSVYVPNEDNVDLSLKEIDSIEVDKTYLRQIKDENNDSSVKAPSIKPFEIQNSVDNDELETLFVADKAELYTDITEQIAIPHKIASKATLYDNLLIVGVLFKTYIICQREESSFIIDQHAAHERVLYEIFLEQFKKEKIASQFLLEPIIYDNDVVQQKIIDQSVDKLNRLGVDIEPFGKQSWIVRSVPIIGKIPLTKDGLYSLLDTFASFEGDILTELSLEKIIRASCRAAVKAHDKLSDLEIMALLEQLKTYDSPYTCPHGRPIIIELTKQEIEKRFKRT